VLVTLLLTALVPASVAAATRPITFSVYIGDACVEGRAADGGMFDFAWERADGSLKRAALAQANPEGYFRLCSSPGVVVEAGDRIMTHDGYVFHELTVPNLTLTQNRVKNLYKGRGPAGQYVRLVCDHGNGFEPCIWSAKIKVNSEGQWGIKPGWNIGANEGMFVTWKSAMGDFVRVRNYSPSLTVRIGSAFVRGTTSNGRPATVALRRGPSFDVRGSLATKSAPLDGRFSGSLKNQQGNKVLVRVGDRITSSVASDLDFIVPDIEAYADSATDHVIGQCNDPGIFNVDIYRNGTFIDGEYWWPEDDGTFDMRFLEFQAGDTVVVRCPVSTGDQVEKAFIAS
jgi:hypothetical protein